MLDTMMVWLTVALAALAFAGALFGFSTALTLIDRLIRPATRPVRVNHRMPRLPRLPRSLRLWA